MSNKAYKDRVFAQDGWSFSSRVSLFGIGVVFLFVMVALPYHALLVSIDENDDRRQNAENDGLQYRDACGIYTHHVRGNIVDRNGKLLAISRISYNLGVKAANVSHQEAEKLAIRLTSLVRGIDKQKTVNILKKKKGYSIVKTRVPLKDWQVLDDLPLEDLLAQQIFRNEEEPLPSRYYPKGRLTSEVVGEVVLPKGANQLTSHSRVIEDEHHYYYKTSQHYGITGIESGMDCTLREGKDVETTLDVRLQHMLRENLQAQKEKFRAKQAGGVLLDIETGDILALVSLPDFDPNLTRYEGHKALPNMITSQRFEMGSVFKIVNFAIAFEYGSVDFQDTFDIKTPIRTASGFIRDYRPKKNVLVTEEVFTHSSNKGSVLMARAIDLDFYRERLQTFGLLSALRVAGMARGVPLQPKHSMARALSENERDYISHGYGLEITPLQLGAVIATIMNDGKRVNVRLVKDGESPLPSQVLQKNTSHAVRHLMYRNVENGSGTRAAVAGVFLGGKTGSANKISEKIEAGKVTKFYDQNRNISSFIATFPIEKPRYILLIVFDEPLPITEGGFATGGVVAAPVVREFIGRAQFLLQLQSNLSEYTSHKLLSTPESFQ